MSSSGLWMLLVLGVLIVSTGLPVWALLLGTASSFALLGLMTSAFDWHILMAMPSRIVGLLEFDLLQALPLYVLVAVLLQHLNLTSRIYRSLVTWGGGSNSARRMAVLGVGTLIAPMNGSVASSSALLSRTGISLVMRASPNQSVALMSAAATIGVVVPPSLVLILLGDAMMRAHTEASHLPGWQKVQERIINTQDVLHAALLPAACVVALWCAICWYQARSESSIGDAVKSSRRDDVLTILVVLVICVLLGSVFTGRLTAVEAAATGGCLLLLLVSIGQLLRRDQWSLVMLETMELSGALFALLVGATTFSLVFRAFGTDAWLNQQIADSSLSSELKTLLLLCLVIACAWVLDAFEMIFVVIPIVAPALILYVGDAQQTSVLLLLLLQMSFLMPPMGYAVVMALAHSGLHKGSRLQVFRSLLPYLAAQAMVMFAVVVWPALCHQLDRPIEATPPASAASDAEVIRQMEEMSRQGQPGGEDKP